MNVIFKTSFFRDVRKAPVALHAEVKDIIEAIENSQSLKDIPGIKKLTGYTIAYRIKLMLIGYVSIMKTELLRL